MAAPPRFLKVVSAVALAAGAVRAVGLVRELWVAGRFGTGDPLEAFLLAVATPLLVAGTLRSAIVSSLLPRLVKVRESRGREAASRLLASAIARHVLVATSAAVLLALVSGPLVEFLASGFPPDKRLLTHRLFLWLLPLVALDGLSAVWSAAVQAEGRVVVATLGLAGGPVATVGALAAMPGGHPEILVIGAVLGSAAEAVWMAVQATRAGWPPWRIAAPWAAESVEAARGFALLAAGSALVALNPIVDQVMAAHLGAGSVAQLGYGGRLVGGILGLVGMAIGTATLPRYAVAAARGEAAGVAKIYRRDATAAAAGGLVVAAAVALLSTPIIRLLFERGAFTAADTAVVSKVQIAYATQIPGFLAGLVGARVLNALGRDVDVVVLSAFGAVLNVVGNVVLARWLGVTGIALSTGLVYTGTAIAIAVAVGRSMTRVGRDGDGPGGIEP